MPIYDHEWAGLKQFEPRFAEGDGILYVADRARVQREMNIRGQLNRHAPFSPGLSMGFPDAGGALIDSFFGYAYSGIPAEGSAVYGPTETLLPGPLDRLVDPTLGFLRVPFKRIPRLRARSVVDLEEVIKFAEDFYGRDRILFRGQTQEYYLNRSPEFCRRFYGEDTIREPSLISSAVRRPPSIRTCMPEFMMWLQLWQQTALRSLRSRYEGVRVAMYDKLAAEAAVIWGQPRFYFQALAIAQHYGLPSVGLDVSSDLMVALFFATRESISSGNQKMRFMPLAAPRMPVIYLILREGSREYAFEDSAPSVLLSGRAAKQKAWFFHLGWGLSVNAAADQILAAVYLDLPLDGSGIPQATELFPPADEDSLGSFLGSIGNSGSKALRTVLSSLYWVDGPL